MKKLITHKITSSILVLVFFVVSNVYVSAEQVNQNNQKLQTWKLKQIINNTWNKINSGQILTQEQKNKIHEQLNKQLNKVKPGDLNKAFSWAMQKIKQMTPEEKTKMLNSAKQILNAAWSWNVAKIKNQIEAKKQEVIKNVKQEIKNQKDQKIEEAKKQFEIKKQEILNKVKAGKLWNEEAKKQILANRDVMIEKTKANILTAANNIKQEKINNVKSIVKKQFETKLADISKLSTSEQKAKYEKLDAGIDKLAKTATKAQNEVYKIMHEVLREKIDSLK